MASPREDTNRRSVAGETVREVLELPRTDGPSLKALNLPKVLSRRAGFPPESERAPRAEPWSGRCVVRRLHRLRISPRHRGSTKPIACVPTLQTLEPPNPATTPIATPVDFVARRAAQGNYIAGNFSSTWSLTPSAPRVFFAAPRAPCQCHKLRPRGWAFSPSRNNPCILVHVCRLYLFDSESYATAKVHRPPDHQLADFLPAPGGRAGAFLSVPPSRACHPPAPVGADFQPALLCLLLLLPDAGGLCRFAHFRDFLWHDRCPQSPQRAHHDPGDRHRPVGAGSGLLSRRHLLLRCDFRRRAPRGRTGRDLPDLHQPGLEPGAGRVRSDEDDSSRYAGGAGLLRRQRLDAV